MKQSSNLKNKKERESNRGFEELKILLYDKCSCGSTNNKDSSIYLISLFNQIKGKSTDHQFPFVVQIFLLTNLNLSWTVACRALSRNFVLRFKDCLHHMPWLSGYYLCILGWISPVKLFVCSHFSSRCPFWLVNWVLSQCGLSTLLQRLSQCTSHSAPPRVVPDASL